MAYILQPMTAGMTPVPPPAGSKHIGYTATIRYSDLPGDYRVAKAWAIGMVSIDGADTVVTDAFGVETRIPTACVLYMHDV